MLTELINTTLVNNIVVSERMKVYEASYHFELQNAPEFTYFIRIMDFVSCRDKIKITIQDENERIFDFTDLSAREDTYIDFIKSTLEDEQIEVRIKIDKKVMEHHFSIYSFDEFLKDIISLPIEKVMISFSDLFADSPEFLIFDVFSPITMFGTKTMFFVPNDNNEYHLDFCRLQRIEECKEVSYFFNFDTYEVLPDDFHIMIDNRNNPLSELFHKITALLSISFIASSASITGSQLKGIIHGQRTVEYSCDINNLNNNKILYRIYNWIYTGGNAVDKAIIARNVLSLHCKYVSITDIDDKVMASIQSNYNLYLKDNVKEYLDLKNKVAEFISEIVVKTGEYATGLLDKFKSNIIAIFGFLFTVILANIVSSQPLDNLFTKEITILVESVLLGSFVYLYICYLQSCFEIQKVYDSYGQLKANYDNILTQEDMFEIFGNDDMLKKMQKTIKKSQKLYLIIWIGFLVLSFLIIEIISSNPSYKYIINFLHDLSSNFS